MTQTTEWWLLADVGGTKTQIALVRSDEPFFESSAYFLNEEFDHFKALIRHFLESSGSPHVTCAVFGVAGPVLGERKRVQITNYPWTLSQEELQVELPQAEIHFLNDLESCAYGVSLLPAEAKVTLQEGIFPQTQGYSQLVLAVGTGLGQALRLVKGADLQVLPSEAGQSAFAPQNEEEIELWSSLRKNFFYIPVEKVLSGSGILKIFRFYADRNPSLYSKELQEALREEEKNASRILCEKALKRTDPLCEQALKRFVEILGFAMGNSALNHLALGGVYLAGSLCAGIVPLLKEGSFLQSFCGKGAFEGLLKQIPVHVVTHPSLALLGAQFYAQTLKTSKETKG